MGSLQNLIYGDNHHPETADRLRGNVFVANLPTGYSDEQLAQLFDQFGIVLGAYLARDATTQSTKGYGLVNIAPPRDSVA